MMLLIPITMLILATATMTGFALSPEIINSPLGQTADLDARLEYLRKFEYLPPKGASDSNDALLELADVQGAVMRMQRYGNIPQTGLFDAATLALMETPRCGVPDPVGVGEDGTALGGRLKKYAHTGATWERKNPRDKYVTIVYRILNTAVNRDISPQQSRTAIRNAFQLWADVAPFEFREVETGAADIYLQFGTGYHGDGYPFDGYGGTLAHAFPPQSGFGDLDGDVHFDDSEPFTVGSPDGINLDFVASHEIGHALGLAHSEVAGALMAPYYQGYTPNYRLPYDDQVGMQILYGSTPGPRVGGNPGSPAGTNRPATRAVPATTVPGAAAGACNSLSFTGIGYIRQELFAFQNDRYWRIRQNQEVLTDIKGDETKYFWMDLPAGINGAYERYHDQHILFFKGDQYWEYNGLSPLPGFPKLLSELNKDLPTNFDAVMTYDEYYKTYFFKGDQVWRLDEGTKTIDIGWPYRIDEVFYGIPSNLGAAFRYKDGIPIFVKGSQYYMFNDATGEVNSGFPKSFSQDFLGCLPDKLIGPTDNGASTQNPALLGIVLGTIMMLINQIL